ncbi:MAG: PEP/pyruvate-binding domain-containing protein [Flavobacteriales bacterium]
MKSLMGLYFVFLFALFSCEPLAQDYMNELRTEDSFQALQREPLSAKYAQAQAVKLVYDLYKKEVYYISNSFQYHNKFCQEVLGYDGPLGIFNRDNYGTDPSKRQFLLANINYFPSDKKYVLELSPSDHMSIEHINFLHKTVVNSSFLTKDLEFLLNNLRLIELSDELAIPTITSKQIYHDQQFQPVSKFSAIGKLRKVNLSALDTTTLSATDIVIIDGTPLQMAAVAGVITTDLQTPLSHLSILGQNRKVPVMALKNAWTNPRIDELLGYYVELKVEADGYTLSPAEPPEENSKTQRRKSLKSDLSETELLRIRDLDRKSAKAFGYKAENLGVLYELSQSMNFSVPEAGFGIPFYYYNEHRKKAGVTSLIYSLETAADPKSILAEIRDKIKSTPVNPAHLEAIENRAKEISTYRRLRFRSSTNAEDMKGFSGAGLYTSKTGIIDSRGEKPVESALQNVWASLWNDAAYLEREYYNFKHEDAMMGVLVHRSFPAEEVNGVAITQNLYRENNLGFVVNAQLGEVSVVQPDPNITCDQFICYPTKDAGFYSQNETIEIITTSSLNDNRLVMTKDEIHNLANVLNEIKKYFYYRDFTTKTFNEYGLDLEFKLDKDTRELYIKQVRPYNN